MTHSPSDRIERVADDLRDRGFTLDTDSSSPTARDGPTDLAAVDAPLAVIPISDSNPLTIISAVATAAHDGHVPLLIVDGYDRDSVVEFLSSPFALAGEQNGLRQFHTVEDRIQLTDDSFACVTRRGGLSWIESTETDQAESPQLHLTAGEETVSVLDSVEGLACPGPSATAFRHRYERGDDGRFRVYEGETVVGEYVGVTAMRADGVRPVPLPLVPEHHVRSNGHLARAVVVATADDGGVRYANAEGLQ
jgi:hypothetical protein